MSLSWSDNRHLYTSASITKFYASIRVSQSGIKSDSRHTQKMLWYAHTLGCTWGIKRPLHIKCQNSSSYNVDKNRCTVEEAVMTIALPILCCSLQAYSIDYRDKQSTTVKLESANSYFSHGNNVSPWCVYACKLLASQHIWFPSRCKNMSNAEIDLTCSGHLQQSPLTL